LSGRLDAAAFRAALRDEPSDLIRGSGPATFVTEAPAEPAADEPAEAYLMRSPGHSPGTGPLAVTPRRRAGNRPDSKQARMIEMLRRPEGATVEQIAEEMGWARHTVRGAMAGALKKKLGLTITTERVRCVGPSHQGARGSYTIYRIAE
jgi:hypothetical protein